MQCIIWAKSRKDWIRLDSCSPQERVAKKEREVFESDAQAKNYVQVALGHCSCTEKAMFHKFPKSTKGPFSDLTRQQQLVLKGRINES